MDGKAKNEKKTEDIQWDNKPSSIFGWLLWTFDQKHWKTIIQVVALFIAVAAVYGTYLLFAMRSMEIDSKITKKIKDEKISLWERSKDAEWKIALLNIWNKAGEVPEEIWKKAIESKNPEVRIAMASNPWVPNRYKEILIGNENERVKIAAILNRRDRDKAIEMMAKCENKPVLLGVAESPKTPEKILEKLAKDHDEYVRKEVAKNTSTPFNTLKRLTVDKNKYVRTEAISSIISRPASEWKQ